MAARRYVNPQCTSVRRDRVRPSAIIAILLCSVGCGQESEDRSTTGGATFVEYEAAVFAYRDCMEAAGYPLERIQRTTRFGVFLYDYLVSSGGVESGADTRCYDNNLAAVDAVWQQQIASFLAENPSLDPTYVFLRDCAEQLGLEIIEAPDINTYLSAIEGSGYSATTDCLVPHPRETDQEGTG